MSKGVYKFSGIPVQIDSVYRRVHLMSSDYLCRGEQPVLSIATTIEDIEFERQKDAKENPDSEGLDSSNGYLETLAVYRKLAIALADYDTLLMHGSSIAVDGQGVLFTALSGTGKSTHTRMWHDMLGERFMYINDDKPLIKVLEGDDAPLVYGTPWDGKHHLSNNVACPLRAIVKLMRGDNNEIREIKPSLMFPTLIQQTFTSSDPAVASKVLSLLSRLAEKVRFYELYCNMNPEAAEVSYSGIFGN